MATVTTSIGPADHGRPIGEEEFYEGDFAPGWRYELIDGRVSVSPAPGLSHDDVAEWLSDVFKAYARLRPDVFDYVSRHPRIYVPGRARPTRPEPDVAVFQNYPHHLPRRQRHWRDQTPYLVVEILSPDSREKDTVRNVELYGQVPSIREYWVMESDTDDVIPGFRVYRRRGGGWQRPIDVPPGGGYTSRWLPGFTLGPPGAT